MQDNNFNFNFDDFDDISSSSKRDKVDDFITNVNRNMGANNKIGEDYYMGNHYRKKKHGLAKKISDTNFKIRKWWKCMKKGKRRAIIIISSIVLALLIMLGTFFAIFDYNYNSITTDPKDLGFKGVIDENIINVALFGIDSRDTNGKTSFKGNSDSIMILSINTDTKKVKIISLMRDTLVPIERESGLTYNKINSAYSWGGPELAIKTINQNFGLDISEYATVNFYGMSDIIDAVGGIDVTLTKDEVSARGENNHGINDMIGEICQYKKLNPNDYYVTTSGEQHLNGVQAVAYARIRYCKNIWGTSNDYGRTDRQRYVMEQLFNKAKTLGKDEDIKLAKALIPCTETSLSYTQIIGIAFNVMFSSPTFEQYRVPQNTTDMNFLMPSPQGSFGSVVYFDLDYASKLIHSIIYDDMTIEDFVAKNPIEKNDWYAKRNKTSGKTYSSSTTQQNSNTQTETPVAETPVAETPTEETQTQEATTSETTTTETTTEKPTEQGANSSSQTSGDTTQTETTDGENNEG